MTLAGTCVAFGVDNTNVNMGRRNSILALAIQSEPECTRKMNLPILWDAAHVATCHMVHNTACKASEVFEAETAFAVEDLFFDLYYWFDKSTEKK